MRSIVYKSGWNSPWEDTFHGLVQEPICVGESYMFELDFEFEFDFEFRLRVGLRVEKRIFKVTK